MTELQARNERKAEMAALTRDELIGVLTDVVHATRARLSEARTADGLKAAEMLTKMCGWNEPEKVKHDHVQLQVDSALIGQLRAGYGQLASKGGPIGLGGGHPRGSYPQSEATSPKRGHRQVMISL
jgi:hypothetical protein